jgi:multidrug resistance efflux pump
MNKPKDSDGSPPAAPVTASPGGNTTLTDRVRSLRLKEEAAAVGPWRGWLPWALCLFLGCSTLALAAVAFSRGTPSADGKTDAGTDRPGFSAPGPGAAAGEVVLESKGYIVPVHQIQVSPKVSGLVLELHVEEGKQVKKGDILAKLETVEYEAERNRARAQLDGAWQRFLELYTGFRVEEIKQAKAELDEAEAQRAQLYTDWKRSIALNRQTLAPREFEQIESAYKAADRRVARLRSAYHLMLEGPRLERIQLAWAEVMQAEAELTRAQWRLDNCVVRAPVSGTILTKKAEEGNIVNPSSFGQGGALSASLCDMADLSDLEVDLNIQERDIAGVFKGQRCRIRPEAFPKREYQGHVSRLMPIADRAKGAIPVRVKVIVPREEEGKFLKPEMSVLVSFLGK